MKWEQTTIESALAALILAIAYKLYKSNCHERCIKNKEDFEIELVVN